VEVERFFFSNESKHLSTSPEVGLMIHASGMNPTCRTPRPSRLGNSGTGDHQTRMPFVVCYLL